MRYSEGVKEVLFLKNKDIPYSTLSQVTPTLQPDRFMAKLRELFKIDSSYTDDQIYSFGESPVFFLNTIRKWSSQYPVERASSVKSIFDI